jgi:chorismate mutase / prephenate dehydratase
MADTVTSSLQRIDRIDDQILDLIARRVRAVRALKQAKGMTTAYHPDQEAMLLRRLSERNQGPLPDEAIAAIFTEIIAACRSLQRPLRVTYLGPAGSYSHEAALQLVGSSVELIPQASLGEALRAAETGSSDVALLPIENSSEGMVVETHKLLRTTPLTIMDETRLDIRHCLLSRCDALTDISQVYAHPQALGQCRNWLQTHLPHAELIAQSSNSRAAEMAAATPHTAAIASRYAARLVGLAVLASNINDNPANQTRFILLGSQQTEPTGNDKTSLICTTKDVPGALHALLGIFVAHAVNLVRLESQPASNHDYLFYIDIEGHQADTQVAAALEELRQTAKDCKVLGSYPKARGARHGRL